MLLHEMFATAELKFIDTDGHGHFGGLGAVYGNTDDHGDVIVPGAFEASLAERKQQGRGLPKMYFDHSAYKIGGAARPVGKWDSMVEEEGGLRVKGHLFSTDLPDIKYVYELMQENELGLSIAFRPRPGGVEAGRKPSEPKRTLKSLELFSVDLVSEPSNPLARIDHFKSFSVAGDQQGATEALVQAIALHMATTTGGNSPSADQRAMMLKHLQTAHQKLTGQAMPPGMKSIPETIREFEEWLRDPVVGLGWSHSRARAVAESGFKSLPRDGERETAADVDQEVLREISASLDGFSLPSF